MKTAWMIRNDGAVFPCVCHTYGSWDVGDIEETLSAAEWLYGHTSKQAAKTACMELIAAWAVECSGDDTDIVSSVFKEIDSRPYRFLTKEFIASHADELKCPSAEYTLESLNEDVNIELNQEFLRARYGGLYDTDYDVQDMFFRVSSAGFDWYPIICKFVEESPYVIQTVTVVRDAESTGGNNRVYENLSRQGIYLRCPLNDFLRDGTDPANKGKRMTVAPKEGDSTLAQFMQGLAQGRSLRELRELKTDLKLLARKYWWVSNRETLLTSEVVLGGRE